MTCAIVTSEGDLEHCVEAHEDMNIVLKPYIDVEGQVRIV